MGSELADDGAVPDTAEQARGLLDRAAVRAAGLARVQRELVGELIGLWPTSAWLAAGATSAKAWLLAYSSLSEPEAHRLVKVAELCAAHPVLAGAVTSGELAVKRAWTLARVVTAERAPFVAEVVGPLLGLNGRTGDDEEFAAGVRFWVERVDEAVPVRREGPHWLALTPSLFGGGDINGQLSPSAFANVGAAVGGWVQDPDPVDAPYRRSLRERQADALDDLCAASLPGGTGGEVDDDVTDEELEARAGDTVDGWAGPDDLDETLAHAGCPGCADCDGDGGLDPLVALRGRLARAETARRRRLRRRMKVRSGATVNATVDIRTLLGLRDRTDLDDLVYRGDGFTLTRGVLERLCCDTGMLTTLFDGPRSLIDANARTEHFTTTQRRAIAARDRCCVFPGCRRPPRHCDIHHLQPRSHGGPTRAANGALLCRFHHRLVHDHHWQLRLGDDGHWIATDPHGRTWTGRPAPPTEATAA